MRKHLLKFSLFLVFLLNYRSSMACHGVALVNYSYSVGATGVTVNASSNSATCGCGPYWMQVEVACTAAAVSGTPPAAMQNTLATWTGGTTYNSHPWYNSLLNVANYSAASGWPDNCVTEPYNPIFIPFSGLCPGQTYYFAAREWLGGNSSAGPWTAVTSFTVPGILIPLSASVSANPTTVCSGQCATLSVTGITGGCGSGTTVTWSHGLGTGLTKNVCPTTTTTYSATVSTGCNTMVYPVTVTVIPSVTATFTASANQCLTGNSFTFTHTGTAGIPTHTWNWGDGTPNGSGSSATHSYGSAGSYVVTHTATAGTCSATATQTVTVFPMPNTPTLTPVHPLCGMANGSISVTASGGNAPYTYSINGGAFQASSTFSGLVAGPYTITVQTANGCQSSASLTLVDQGGPTAMALSSTPDGCGTNTGAISIGAVTGGTPTYSFSLNNSAGPFAAVTGFSGLATGTYTVYLQDASGCLYNQSVTVGTSSGPTAVALSSTPDGCGTNTGAISIGAVTGGTPTYSFSLNNSAGPFSAVTGYSGLATGTYTVYIQDANNCLYNQSVFVGVSSGPTAITYTTVPSACTPNNGQITVTGVTGGTAPYQYSFDNGGTFGASNTTTGLAPGSYTVVIKDANNCVYSETVTITITPSPTNITYTSQLSSCGQSNGSLTATGVGGTAPYTYSLNGGTGQASGTFSSLAPGPYSVMVTDANGCTFTNSTTVNTTPTPTVSVTSVTHILCNGGTNGAISVSGAGGVAPYQYAINPPGTTNASGTFSGLTAGTYVIGVSDSAGCVDTVSATITEPSLLTNAITSVVNVTCNGANDGSISASASGGTTAYSYSLNGGTGQASGTFSGLASGPYTITVTDANGCTATANGTITEPTPLVLSATSVASTCGLPNGNATATASGGTQMAASPFYTFIWNTTTPQMGPNATGLASGSYTCTVIDSMGCYDTVSVFVGSMPGPSLSSITQTPVSCNGLSDGAATVVIAGGTGAVNYVWLNSAAVNQNTNNDTITNIPADTYSVQATDANGCVVNGTVTVTQPNMLTLQTSPQDTICFGQSAGVSSSSTGGTAPYNFLWTDGSTTWTGAGPHTVSPLTTTTYSVTVTDNNGCTIPGAQVLILVRPPLNSITNDAAACHNDQVSISASAGGGNGGPYTFTWIGLGVGQTQTVTANINQNPKAYAVTISDGCTTPITDTVWVSAYALPSVQIVPDVDSGCEPLDVNFAAVSDNGVSFTWNYGDSTALETGDSTSHTFVNDGAYDITLTVVSAQSCTTIVTNPQMITVYPLPVAEFSSTPLEPSVLNPIVNFFNQSVGASTYQWDFGDPLSFADSSAEMDPYYTYLEAGDYTITLTVTTQYGCQDVVSHDITVKPDFAIFVPNAFSPDDDGVNDVFRPEGVGLNAEKYHLFIYDRWGAKIFESNNWNIGWDGKANNGNDPAQIDVYVWRIIVNDYKGEKHTYTGHVTVVK